jgi:hypothetical protein
MKDDKIQNENWYSWSEKNRLFFLYQELLGVNMQKCQRIVQNQQTIEKVTNS